MQRFYCDVLGYERVWAPSDDDLYLSRVDDNLALHRAPPEASRSQGPLDHLGFAVQQPEHVDAWAAYLASRGVSLAQPPKTHRDGSRSLYVHDPEGNLVQIICLAS